MGSYMSSALDENMKKSQEFMMETQKLTLQRQLAMQNAMLERQMAMQVSRARELLNWTGSFSTIAAFGLTAGALKNRKPHLLAPLLPIGFVVGYQWDMAYNNKMIRIRNEAENIITNEIDLLKLPHGMPNFNELESRRSKAAS